MVSWPTAPAAFAAHAESVLGEPAPVAVLALTDNDPSSQILAAYIAKGGRRRLLTAARDRADDAEIPHPAFPGSTAGAPTSRSPKSSAWPPRSKPGGDKRPNRRFQPAGQTGQTRPFGFRNTRTQAAGYASTAPA